jgi:hypothetical protein
MDDALKATIPDNARPMQTRLKLDRLITCLPWVFTPDEIYNEIETHLSILRLRNTNPDFRQKNSRQLAWLADSQAEQTGIGRTILI